MKRKEKRTVLVEVRSLVELEVPAGDYETAITAALRKQSSEIVADGRVMAREVYEPAHGAWATETVDRTDENPTQVYLNKEIRAEGVTMPRGTIATIDGNKVPRANTLNLIATIDGVEVLFWAWREDVTPVLRAKTEARPQTVREQVEAYDKVLTDAERVPTADDYNALWGIVMGTPEKTEAPDPHMPEAPEGLLENVAALSGAMHTHPRYQEFYETFQDRISGFTGIYQIVINLARELWEFEKAESPENGTIWDEIDWVSTVDKAVDYLIEDSMSNHNSGYTYVAPAKEVIAKTIDDQRETWSDDHED
jgi:hypothetical protein